jgi:diaminohydroxyphosphoribosylaminopyrimidine deaminase/5-amino-6-(5-phosphoribosylamino)uracil reductase
MSQGIEIWSMPEAMDQMHLAPGLRRLRQEKGCYSILCEGGGRLALSLVAMNLVDEFHLFLAPKVFGDQEAVNSFSGRCLFSMDDVLRFRISEYRQTGEDLWLTLRPK